MVAVHVPLHSVARTGQPPPVRSFSGSPMKKFNLSQTGPSPAERRLTLRDEYPAFISQDILLYSTEYAQRSTCSGSVDGYTHLAVAFLTLLLKDLRGTFENRGHLTPQQQAELQRAAYLYLINEPELEMWCALLAIDSDGFRKACVSLQPSDD